MSDSSADVTLLLKQLSHGNQDVLAELIPLVYDELRRLAAFHLRQERSNHTLQATALVHEAYLRLVDQRHVDWKNRSHFFGVAVHLMRRILLMHARRVHAAKRGGEGFRISLDEAVIFTRERSAELLALDGLLTRLSTLDPQQARIVDLGFFAGLSVDETADLLGISTATVTERDWAMAQAWLAPELGVLAKSKAGG